MYAIAASPSDPPTYNKTSVMNSHRKSQDTNPDVAFQDMDDRFEVSIKSTSLVGNGNKFQLPRLGNAPDVPDPSFSLDSSRGSASAMFGSGKHELEWKQNLS